VFVSIFFALKAELQVLKFEFYQIKLEQNQGWTCNYLAKFRSN